MASSSPMAVFGLLLLACGTAAAARVSAAAPWTRRLAADILGLEAPKGPAGEQRVVLLNALTCNGTALAAKNQSTLTCHNGTAERTATGQVKPLFSLVCSAFSKDAKVAAFRCLKVPPGSSKEVAAKVTAPDPSKPLPAGAVILRCNITGAADKAGMALRCVDTTLIEDAAVWNATFGAGAGKAAAAPTSTAAKPMFRTVGGAGGREDALADTSSAAAPADASSSSGGDSSSGGGDSSSSSSSGGSGCVSNGDTLCVMASGPGSLAVGTLVGDGEQTLTVIADGPGSIAVGSVVSSSSDDSSDDAEKEFFSNTWWMEGATPQVIAGYTLLPFLGRRLLRFGGV